MIDRSLIRMKTSDASALPSVSRASVFHPASLSLVTSLFEHVRVWGRRRGDVADTWQSPGDCDAQEGGAWISVGEL